MLENDKVNVCYALSFVGLMLLVMLVLYANLSDESNIYVVIGILTAVVFCFCFPLAVFRNTGIGWDYTPPTEETNLLGFPVKKHRHGYDT